MIAYATKWIVATGIAIPALVLGACGPARPDTAGSAGSDTADPTNRVDLETPTFSDPASITNPLFPITEVTHAIQLGDEAGQLLRHEITLMPETKVIEWDGRQVEAVVSQFVGYLDGRLLEVAYDYFAQADDGSVWYFGEDVFNYEDGVIVDGDGTWLAGRDGPPGMIMPAAPQVGDVYRPENIPGVVFEEVTVQSVGNVIEGPRGVVEGAVTIQEELMDGTLEDKTFAPGYGEFSALVETEDESVTVAVGVPTDAVSSGLPQLLADLQADVDGLVEAAQSGAAAGAAADAVSTRWAGVVDAGAEFQLLEEQVSRAVNAVNAALGRSAATVTSAALTLAEAVLDLRLPYEEPSVVDLERLCSWTSRLLLDTSEQDEPAMLGDVAVLETIWARTGHLVDPAAAGAIDSELMTVAAATDPVQPSQLATAAESLQTSLSLAAPGC